MLDSPGSQSDVSGLLSQELCQPAGVTLQAVVVVPRHCEDQVSRLVVRTPASHHQPQGVLLTTSQTSHQLDLVDWLGVPGQSGVGLLTDTPLS